MLLCFRKYSKQACYCKTFISPLLSLTFFFFFFFIIMLVQMGMNAVLRKSSLVIEFRYSCCLHEKSYGTSPINLCQYMKSEIYIPMYIYTFCKSVTSNSIFSKSCSSCLTMSSFTFSSYFNVSLSSSLSFSN